MSKISLIAKKPKNLAEWLNKFTTVSADMLLEIDVASGKLSTKTYSAFKDVVKISEVTFEELEIENKPKNEVCSVDVGVLDITKLIKKLLLYKDSPVTLDIEYVSKSVDNYVIGNSNSVMVNYALTFRIDAKEGKLTTLCGNPQLYKKMTETIVNNILNMSSGCKFIITPQQISKIIAMTSLESKQDKVIKFYIDSTDEGNKVLKVGNRSFEYNLMEGVEGDSQEIVIDLTLMNRLDNESYEVVFNDQKLILKSLDTETTIILCSLDIASA